MSESTEHIEPAAAREVLPAIALVGRTNVGKSTLFNRLTHGRKALVAASPGLTRDRREGRVIWGGRRYRVIDTGGMGFDRGAEFATEIAEQVQKAVADADAVWLVVDGVEGLNPLDQQLAEWLRPTGKAVFTIVNKVDHRRREAQIGDFYALGSRELYSVSAHHGLGIEAALEATAGALPAPKGAGEGGSPASQPPGVRVAIMGKPNVGKSSLVNRVLGEGRMIVSEIAGTTREPVDVPVEVGGERFTLIDTAGLRRRAKTKLALDKIGAATSLGALERADVAVLVIDALEPISEQDAKIAGHIELRRRAVVLALNKWDLVKHDPRRADEIEKDVRHRLRFIPHAALVKLSAAEGEGIEQLFQEVRMAFREFERRIQTADLNRIIGPAVLSHPPPGKGRSATKIHYGTQVGVRPPVFCFFTNHPECMTPAYTRYFTGRLRYHFGLQGTPIAISWRGRERQAEPANKRVEKRAGGARP